MGGARQLLQEVVHTVHDHEFGVGRAAQLAAEADRLAAAHLLPRTTSSGEDAVAGLSLILGPKCIVKPLPTWYGSVPSALRPTRRAHAAAERANASRI